MTWLACHYFFFRTIGVKLVRTDFSIETRETTFAESRNDKEDITLAIQPLLQRFTLSHTEAAIRKVGLKLSHLSKHGDVDPEDSNIKRKGRSLGTGQKTLSDYL